MARRGHPIHTVVEREFGYSSNGAGRNLANPGITGRLDAGGDEAEKDCYQDCMVEGPLEDPAITELEGMAEERDLLDAINRYLHLSTRGGENHRFRLWSSDGIPLRSRGAGNYTDADLIPLEIYGENRNHGKYQLHFVNKDRSRFTEERPLELDDRLSTLWLNYTILKWRLIWIEK